MTRWLSWPDRERLDAGSGRNGRLASAGQRRGAHFDLAVAQRATPRRQHRIPHPGWFSVHPDTDLSRIALGVAAPARDRAPHRSGQAGCDPYRHRRADRPRGGGLLPKARPALHHQLHDALPGIHLGARADPASAHLRGAAAISCRRNRDDGGDAIAHDRIASARIFQPRDVDARRGHRSVQAGSRDRTRLYAPHLHQRRAARGRKEPQRVPLARSSRHEGRHRHRPRGGGAEAALSGREVPRIAGEWHLGRASRGGRRLRVPEPHRHVRRGAARSAGQRRSGCRLSGHGAEGRRGRQSGRSFERKPGRGLYRGASNFSRGVSRVRARPLLGKQRASIHRAYPESGHRRISRIRRGNGDGGDRARLMRTGAKGGRKGDTAMTDLSRAELDQETIAKAYARWAPVYDLVFGAVFERGRHAAIAAAERIGGRILEVGVGTGISLPDYARANRLCGVDISEPMLRKAQQRVAELGLANVEGLWVMDAEHLSFPDASFDVVVAQYVITTVPNPEATLDEFARVLKPGGEIVLVSRVGAEAGLRRALERWFAPAARKLGWRTEFSWERYADWAKRSRGMRLVERRAMPPFGHFSLIRFSKAGGTSAARAEKPAARAAV